MIHNTDQKSSDTIESTEPLIFEWHAEPFKRPKPFKTKINNQPIKNGVKKES
jgi:hypothetical protein